MRTQETRFYRFGAFELDADEGVLRRDNELVSLPPRALELLLALVERHGHLVEKETLMNRVWADAAVEDSNLPQTISVLRKTLGECEQNRFIKNVPKRGYRFVAPVIERVDYDEEEEIVLIEHREDVRLVESGGKPPIRLLPDRFSGRTAKVLIAALALTLCGVVAYVLIRDRHLRRIRAEAEKECIIASEYLNQRTSPDFDKARLHFTRALEKDPDYAPAYAGIANSYAIQGSTGYDLNPQDTLPKAMDNAMRAIDLDRDLTDAYTARGIAYLLFYWDKRKAKQDFERALQLSPKNEAARYWHVVLLIADGLCDQAIDESSRSSAEAPESSVLSANVGRAFYYAGQYDAAIKQCQKTLQSENGFLLARLIEASAKEQEGKHDEAIYEFELIRKDSKHDPPVLLGLLGAAYASAGMQGEAKGILKELESRKANERNSGEYISPSYLATIYAALGETDRAFDSLEMAFKERASSLVFLNVEPTLAVLKSDPKFDALVSRVKPN
jgi:DNA-binding winged helix-turn-helix (wHTH) protein/tetratricopeptide (TPR) repeat protein